MKARGENASAGGALILSRLNFLNSLSPAMAEDEHEHTVPQLTKLNSLELIRQQSHDELNLTSPGDDSDSGAESPRSKKNRLLYTMIKHTLGSMSRLRYNPYNPYNLYNLNNPNNPNSDQH